MIMTLLSSQQRHAIGVEAFITGHDRQSFSNSLSYQHAVEGILMMAWEPSGRDAVGEADRQGCEPAFLYLLFKVIGCGKFPQGFFDGDLPGAGGRDGDEIGRIGYRLARWGVQAFVGQPPQQSVGI